MKSLFTLTALAAGALATPALAQDYESNRIEPYVAIVGAHHDFDSEASDSGFPANGPSSGLFEGIVGVNVPLGSSLFVGVEGFGAKAVKGPEEWEYGAAARAGIRMRDSSMIYGKVGRRWVQFNNGVNPDYTVDDMVYGAGFELSPGGNASRVRIRGEIETFGDFGSIRPSMGVSFGF